MDSKPNIAKVVVNLSLDKVFDYSIPPELVGVLRIGMRVNVPFGHGERLAYIVSFAHSSSQDGLKSIISICDNHPSIPDSLIKLAEWISDYYCCAREQSVKALLPGAVRSGKVKAKTRAYYSVPDQLAASKYIAEHGAKAKSRAAIIKTLMLKPGGMEAEVLLFEAGASDASLKSLVKEGIVVREERKTERNPFDGLNFIPTQALTPNPEQTEALQKIFAMMDDRDSGGQHVLLLHGVTSSGKTEVYLQSIARALAEGGESIVLVPEISLTPQTVERFRARFGDMVSVLHSGLTDGERYDEWMKVHTGKVKIVVGARSALFAPFRNLSLIIVDEEHENSYKQSESPRYNARDVAVMRGKLEKAVVILGSATPSMESYYNAASGKYHLSKLRQRSDPSILMPEIKIVDMRLETAESGKTPFLSKMLVQAVRERISRGEQSIIFLNRRGYARQMVCDLCGEIAMCPECSVPYTYHRRHQILTCHFCASSIPAPEVCPKCQSENIRYSGAGTERIENIGLEVFKGARIARMDSDTMTNPGLYSKVLGQFRRGDLDILVGTQMIAKGLHFPNVTFVGIVNADMGMMMPDFRAAERGFQLITQVAGRAGRGDIKGEVLIQTHYPFNPSIQFAAKHDYEGFYEEEMLVRSELKYPPFGHLIAVHFRSEDKDKLEAYASSVMEGIRSCIDPETTVSEPSPAPIERIKGKYRYIAMFRGGKLTALRRALRREILGKRRPAEIECHIDVDALSLM